MKKTALFLSIFSLMNSLSALNVIHKESEDSSILVRLKDVTSDYNTNYFSQFYKSSQEWQGYNPVSGSKYYYYKLIIENAFEDQAVVYNAQGSIKDSIQGIKSLIDAKRFQLFLGSIASFAGCFGAGALFAMSKNPSSVENLEKYAGALGVCSILAVLIIKNMKINLEKIDHKIRDYVQIERAFEVQQSRMQENQLQEGIISLSQMKEGLVNIKTTLHTVSGSIIIVSDHELHNVEIDVLQRNEAYYEVTLTEIEN